MQNAVSERRVAGSSAIETCHWFSDQIDLLLTEIVESHLQMKGRPGLSASFCMVAVGGNGRRRPAPYSDVDLLFITDPKCDAEVGEILSAVVRSFWDARLQPGHSIRTPADVIRFASEDVQFATSLISMRYLCGSVTLLDYTREQVFGRVLREKPQRLIERCVSARRDEWMSRGNSVNQLEPDIKKSPGGLRDLHLLQWVSFARYGDADLEALHSHREVSQDELATLQQADEYLTGVRLDLHCARHMRQDVLNRDLQVELAKRKFPGIHDTAKAVEAFMQEYFSHTSRVSEIARRVTEFGKKPTLLSRLRSTIRPQRTGKGFLITDGSLSLPQDELGKLKNDPLKILDLFVAAAEARIPLSPSLRKHLGLIAAELPSEMDHEVTRRFRSLLRNTDGLPDALRQMYETGVLEWLIPEFAEIRCLIQFNQYHQFTVDEHTLKAMDEIVSFANDTSPVGSAYQTVRHRATLHLALLMHDIGKGREGDHSLVGAEMCLSVASRLQMAENKKNMLVFLVKHHLVMPNLAFRRDISDPGVLVEFARLVGAPELLRMLYVLTVADIRAVGPDVWSDWKGELLADLYNRTMQVLSGRPYNHLEQERLKIIRDTVRGSIVPIGMDHDEGHWPRWIDEQLDALPAFYLMTEDPSRIARDLDMIQQLNQTDVKIEAEYDPETHTVGYRVFAAERYESGSFHKIAGVLSGLRMDIHAAQICTTADSTLVAAFRVTDNDFSGAVPSSRIEDVAQAITDVLIAKKSVESVFRRSTLFQFKSNRNPVPLTEPQVTIDNDCSERFTVIDIFASDSQGLLYTLARTLFDRQLEIRLARIATHIDQVVDVFYVTDRNQKKVSDPKTIDELRATLLFEINQLAQ
ncbi:MAG: [protein-PII] uridylyltransferase [Planctomycetaceae bacterium]|nr:[protein-PII] uridylyltransferase [Planctomycetaceae bacterium]